MLLKRVTCASAIAIGVGVCTDRRGRPRGRTAGPAAVRTPGRYLPGAGRAGWTRRTSRWTG